MLDHVAIQCADVLASADAPGVHGRQPRGCPGVLRGRHRRGAELPHEPQLWPEYHASYYGAFVRDPDGNNVEAVCHTPG
jgi:catechol 2,3-dioxygenase-like lactoylglutathione lyase family enzyme